MNFATFEGQGGLSYYLKDLGNLVVRALYDYDRLSGTDDFDGIFFSHGFLFNAELPIRLSHNQSLALGVNTRVNIKTHPGRAQRNEVEPYLDYTIGITREFFIDAYAEISLREYEARDRRDGEGMVALSANYRLTNWLTGSVIGSLAANRSNISFYNYNVGNVGGAFELSLKF